MPSLSNTCPLANSTHRAVSFTGDQGFANLEQRLRSPISAVSTLQYYLTLSVAASSIPLDGVSLGLILDSYGFGGITYPTNQPATKIHISGRLDTDSVSLLALAPQSFSSDPGGTLTIDDVSFITYAQQPGLNPIPIPPAVADATYRFNNLDVVKYTMPDIQARTTFTITGSARITLATDTTCWLAMTFLGIGGGTQNILNQQFTANGTVGISISGYLFYLSDAFDLEFACQGVSGSSLVVEGFFLRVF